MGTLCKKCGMESDRKDICTWCNADLRPPKKTGPGGQSGAQAAGRQPSQSGAPARPQQPGAAHSQPGPPVRAQSSTAPRPRAPHVEEVEEAARPPWLVPLIVGGGLVVLLLAMVLVSGAKAITEPPDPGEWKSFTEKDNVLTLSYPGGWGAPSNSGASSQYVSVDWKPTKLCLLSIEGGQRAGAMGDAAAALERAAGGNPPIGQSSDAAVLKSFDATFREKRPGLQIGEAEVSREFAGVRAACFPYTYSTRAGLTSIKMKGLRYGSFQGDFGYQVVMEAPEQHWDKFSQTGRQLLSSVKLGGAR